MKSEQKGDRPRRWGPWRIFLSAVGVTGLALLAAQVPYELAAASPYDLTVLGQDEWTPDTWASLHVRLISHDGARAMPGRPVELVLSGTSPDRNVRLAQAETQPDGSIAPRFRVPDWPDGEYQLRVTAATAGGKETVTRGVDDVVNVVATVANMGATSAPMVVVDLPIAAGFAPLSEDLEALVESGVASKCQRTPRQIIVYLRDLEPGKRLSLRYRLRATMPIRTTVPHARAYSYYEPERQGMSPEGHLSVNAR